MSWRRLSLGGRTECENHKVSCLNPCTIHISLALYTELEALLVVSKIVYMADRAPADEPKPKSSAAANSDDDLDSDDDSKPAARKLPSQGIRGRTTVEDDGSDFDL